VTRIIVLVLLVLAAWTPVRAEGDGDFERVKLRVTSNAAGVTVDRGKREGLEVGDAVVLYPRAGGTYRGVVTQVDDRSAVIELDDKNFVPAAGTRGEVLVPRARLGKEEAPEEAPAEPAVETPEPAPEPEPEPAPAPAKETPPETEPAPDATEHPPWQNKDEDYESGQPLLADVKPLTPRERRKRLTGRAYVVGDAARGPESDDDNSQLRLGTDLRYENPAGRGGELRLNVEYQYLADEIDQLLLKRFSYGWGGTRFDGMRLEIGRFLQTGMPEFGVLDGIEWSYRRDGGNRVGLSFGYLPEDDGTYHSFQDLQVAAHYEWSPDATERLVVTGGYQKTWHDGSADRDLVVGKFRYLPNPEWDFHGSVWVDFYLGGDNVKSESVEVTQAILYLGRHAENGNGFDLTYRHLAFPELLREGEFTPPLPAEIDNNTYDRLALNAWRQMAPGKRVRVYASGFADEDGAGASGELGLDVDDLFLHRSRTGLTLFGAAAQFENVIGARVSFGRTVGNSQWDLFYEVANHYQRGFASDFNDLLQHRVRASAGVFTASGWDVSAHADAVFWDEDVSWSVGLAVQKRF